MEEILKKILEKGWACYWNSGTSTPKSVQSGPVTKLVENQSYFILPMVGTGNDMKATGKFIVNYDLKQPCIRIVSTVVVEHDFGDEHTDVSVLKKGDIVVLNGFRFENMTIVVIAECGKLEVSYAHFFEGIDNIPDINELVKRDG